MKLVLALLFFLAYHDPVRQQTVFVQQKVCNFLLGVDLSFMQEIKIVVFEKNEFWRRKRLGNELFDSFNVGHPFTSYKLLVRTLLEKTKSIVIE